jgi:hypothetical protein
VESAVDAFVEGFIDEEVAEFVAELFVLPELVIVLDVPVASVELVPAGGVPSTASEAHAPSGNPMMMVSRGNRKFISLLSFAHENQGHFSSVGARVRSIDVLLPTQRSRIVEVMAPVDLSGARSYLGSA